MTSRQAALLILAAGLFTGAGQAEPVPTIILALAGMAAVLGAVCELN